MRGIAFDLGAGRRPGGGRADSPARVSPHEAPHCANDVRRDAKVGFGREALDVQVEVEPSALGGIGEHAQGSADAQSNVRRDAPPDALVDQQQVGVAVQGETDCSGLAAIEALQPGNGEQRGGLDADPAG